MKRALVIAFLTTLLVPWLHPILTSAVQSTSAAANPQIGKSIVPPPGTLTHLNVAYGPDPLQTMDIYQPPDADNAPVIFMVHGGGWRRGDKESIGVVQNKINYWIPKGYVFISVNYRFIPDVTPLEEAGDVARALAYAQDNAPTWGADPTSFVLMGNSAGANLVSLLTAAPDLATAQGAGPWLGTVSLDSAAYNVVDIMNQPHLSLYDEAFDGDHQLWHDVSPTLRVESATVPMLLVCSTRRAMSCDQANAFATKAESFGSQITVLPVDLSHGEINANLGTHGDYTSSVEAFLQSLGLP